jgi:hypothetical protein
MKTQEHKACPERNDLETAEHRKITDGRKQGHLRPVSRPCSTLTLPAQRAQPVTVAWTPGEGRRIAALPPISSALSTTAQAGPTLPSRQRDDLRRTRDMRQKSVFQACGAAALLADSSALAGLNLYCRDPLPVTSPPGGASSRIALPARQML